MGHRRSSADRSWPPVAGAYRQVAELSGYLDQGGTATRRRGPALASAFALGRPGRRAPALSHRHVVDQPGPSAQRAVLDGAVFLGDSLSRSRPPCLGRSVRSRRMRSASPNLDPTASRKDSAPIEEEAADWDLARRPWGRCSPRSMQGYSSGWVAMGYHFPAISPPCLDRPIRR